MGITIAGRGRGGRSGIQVWKRLDGLAVKCLYSLRLDLLRYLRPLAEAIEAHLCELHSWATARYARGSRIADGAPPSVPLTDGRRVRRRVRRRPAGRPRSMVAVDLDHDVTLGLDARQLEVTIREARLLLTALLRLDTVLAACSDGWSLFSSWMKTGPRTLRRARAQRTARCGTERGGSARCASA